MTDSGHITVLEAPSAVYQPNSAEHGWGRTSPPKRNGNQAQADLSQWARTLEGAGIPLLEQVPGDEVIGVNLTRSEFDEAISTMSLGHPDDLPLTFTREFDIPTIDPRLEGKVRNVAHGSQPVSIPTIGEYGKLLMRDGCLLIRLDDGTEKIAVIPSSLGLSLDDEGYLAVRYRYSALGHPIARVGTRVGPFMTGIGEWDGSPQAIGCPGHEALAISDVRSPVAAE